jgi:hypothetical protein
VERRHAFEEIMSSEEIYFKNLQFVYWTVITPLGEEVSKGSGVVTQQEIQAIFSNWVNLMQFNKELIQSLHRRRTIAIEERLVGDIFLELVPLMKMYTQYVNNFDHANKAAEACLERDRFYLYVQNQLKEAPTEGLTLMSYLIMPVQRLPRYEMLLRALLKLTEVYHADYDNLERAVAAVKAINDHVNLKKKESDNRELVLSASERIQGFPGLIQAHRMFVREGPLEFSASANPKKTKKRELQHFFLFNDLILRTKPSKKKGGQFTFREAFQLTEYYLRDITYSPFMSSSERFCFRLVKQTDETAGVSFFASSAEEKAEWVLHVEEAIKMRDMADSSRIV